MRLVIALAVVGCGSKAASPSLTPTLPDPGAPSEDGSPAVAHGAPDGLPSAVVEALAGKRMFVADLTGLFLFDDEQLAAQEVIATWATSQGLTMLPPARTAPLFRRAALGQDVVTGKPCGVPLFEFQATERWRAELGADGKIDVSVSCDPDCSVQVALAIGTQGEGGSEFFAAPFDPAVPWRDELARRLPTVADNGGHNEHGHLNNPVKRAGIARAAGANDLVLADPSRFDAKLSPAELDAARRCLADVTSEEVRVGYGAGGAIARCEPARERAFVPACLCQAIAGHRGTPGARERVDVDAVSPPPPKTTDGREIKVYTSPTMIADPGSGKFKPLVSDPALDAWEPPDRSLLAPCFADATAADGDVEARVTIDFDRAGKATKASVAPTTGKLSARAQTCLQRALLATRVPCPATPAPSASADLHVNLSAGKP